VVSFTPRPLYPQGKSPWYSLDRRLGGTQSRSGRGGDENSKPLPGFEPPTFQPVILAVHYHEQLFSRNAYEYMFMVMYCSKCIQYEIISKSLPGRCKHACSWIGRYIYSFVKLPQKEDVNRRHRTSLRQFRVKSNANSYTADISRRWFRDSCLVMDPKVPRILLDALSFHSTSQFPL
jgi:hypothetical protein